MLPCDLSITKTIQFERIKKHGKTFQAENFGVVVLKRGDKEKSKYGFIVSNKVDKGAVHRNRIKRAMREAVRQCMFNTPDGLDFLFLAKKTLLNKTTEEIMNEMKNYILNTDFTK